MEKKNNKNEEQDFQEFYIAVKSAKLKGDFIIYTSESFKLSEIDIITLIKICILETRSKAIGKKILAVYEDSTEDRKELTRKRLKYIGINHDEATTNGKNPTLK
jgi:hypothetical protein